MSYSLSLRDFEPESFALEKYVEKLVQLNPNTGLGPMPKGPFNAAVLLGSFEESIKTLRDLGEKNHRRVEKLEHVCASQEKEHAARLRELEATYQEAFSEFQVLEDRITYVATKVVHLGDQLESSNNRRQRDAEAQRLMKILGEFQHRAKPSLPVFTDPSRKLEAADLIFKLYSLSQELPANEKYTAIRTNISTKYVEIEEQLVDEFIEAHRSLDMKRMKQYAGALQPFFGGSAKVLENYIHGSIPARMYASADELFNDVERLYKKVYDEMVQIFDNPDVVMTRYVEAVMDRVLQKQIDSELLSLSQNEEERERYLQRLYELYGKTTRLQAKLSKYEMSIDPSFLQKMTRVTLFNKYLSGYAELEVAHLKAKSAYALAEFSEQSGLNKKGLGVVRAALPPTRSPDETYVSQEVCTSVLHEAKGAIRRAQVMLSDRELSEMVKRVYFTVLDKLCTEHFLSALDIAITSDPKSSPTGLFCLVVGSVNTNLHLIEKLFREFVMPCIQYPPIATESVEKKRAVTCGLEAKIEKGIERTIAGMVSSVKHRLSTHQKKADYRPEPDDTRPPECTQACLKVSGYIGECSRVLKTSLDGKNLEVVLLELGIRLHRVIYEHLLQYTVSEIGAMTTICDINEYRKAIKEFKQPFLDELFEAMQALCNIFIVKHKNLVQVCSEEPYVSFDRNVIVSMVQMRADYKTAKLAKHFSS